jgi:hypothetical protein
VVKVIPPLKLYAWVGEDDVGDTGRFGLKQGVVPAGYIPLVAMDYHLDRLARSEVTTQMEVFAENTGKKRYLVEFQFTGHIVKETSSGQ